MELNSQRDYKGFYYPVARNIFEGKGLVTDKGYPALLYPPGYPAAIAAMMWVSSWTGANYQTMLALLTLVSFAMPSVLLFNIGWRVAGLRSGLISAALWMTYPAALWISKQPSSDTFFVPFFLAGLLMALPLLLDESDSPALAAGVGAMMGISTLIRPIALLSTPLLALCVGYYGSRESLWRRITPALALLAGCAVVMMPWEVWMYQKTGRWLPASSNGPASMSDGLTQSVSGRAYRQPILIPEGVLLLQSQARELQKQRKLHTTGDIIGFWKDAFSDHPVEAIELVWWKAKRSWYGTDSQRDEEVYMEWIHGFYILLSVAGAVILWRGAGSGRRWLAVSGLILLYYWAMTTAVLSILRYMLPAVAIMFVWLAAFLDHGWQRVRR